MNLSAAGGSGVGRGGGAMIRYLGAAAIVAVFAGAADRASAQQRVFTDAQLLALAGNKYASGELPLGDRRYVTDRPRKGYIFLCRLMQGGGGAQRPGPWIHGTTWNIRQKMAVQGNVKWGEARFSNTVQGDRRVLSGNDLPVSHGTGVFPIHPSDPVAAYDRNPNGIAAQTLHDILPVNPVYSDTPLCMGGESGVMLTGVFLYNGFDANLQDAAAHEAQDGCNGHPQRDGQYHYHSLSNCIRDIGVKTVIGYALDGFPITGPMLAKDKYLTTDDLDECHGIVSEIEEEGRRRVTYHYVMTLDFPYSVSCFRGRPTRIGPSGRDALRDRRVPGGPPGGPDARGGPPPEAIAACAGKTRGAACGFTSPRGELAGSCDAPPSRPLACRPAVR